MHPMVKHHALSAAIAASVAASAVSVASKHVEQVTHSINVSKHAWPDLTDAQKAAFAEAVKGIRRKVDIVSADAASVDLAEDLDDAFEAAGVESVLDQARAPLGYGIAVIAPKGAEADGAQLAAALKAATGGDVPLTTGKYPFLIVAIGKHRQ